MNEKIIKAYNDIVSFNKDMGFIDDEKNVASQVINKIDFSTRLELMQVANTEKYKTMQGKVNACIRYILTIV